MVVNNSNHVSYNGGNGGINARATAAGRGRRTRTAYSAGSGPDPTRRGRALEPAIACVRESRQAADRGDPQAGRISRRGCSTGQSGGRQRTLLHPIAPQPKPSPTLQPARPENNPETARQQNNVPRPPENNAQPARPENNPQTARQQNNSSPSKPAVHPNDLPAIKNALLFPTREMRNEPEIPAAAGPASGPTDAGTTEAATAAGAGTSADGSAKGQSGEATTAGAAAPQQTQRLQQQHVQQQQQLAHQQQQQMQAHQQPHASEPKPKP